MYREVNIIFLTLYFINNAIFDCSLCKWPLQFVVVFGWGENFINIYIFFQIKGLADVANKEDDRGGGSGGGEGGGTNGGMGGVIDPGRDGINNLVASPPPKRSKPSPVESCASGRDSREARELRDARDLIPVEPRDLSREGPCDLSRDLSSHFNLANSNSGHPLVRHPASPTHSLPTPSSLASARSLLYSSSLISRQSPKSPVPSLSSTPYFSGALVRSRSPHHQFDPTPGSSLHPPRTSPQSPAPEHKSGPQIKYVS